MKAILFDLDGTFADTAPDLGHALNLQREARGHQPLPIEPLRKVASSGARGLLGVGFGLKPGDADYEAMRVEFLDLYERNLCRHTRLFPGIPELLDGIEERGLAWGIVTNKATRFTLPLLDQLGIRPRAGCVVCGDTTPHTKPHPAPMFAAAQALGVPAEHCLYVGDDERDMLAGRAAGMRVAVAAYGYLGNGKPPEQWDADHWLRDPREVLALI